MNTKIQVAIRVKPPTTTQEQQKEKLCISSNQRNIKISNKKGDASNEFTFDYCYTSLEKDDPQNDQARIYDDIGSNVIKCALEGYNSCVFAYGQTGSGKTYTMLGTDSCPGLIPRICKDLFKAAKDKEKQEFSFKIEASYLEIYNEAVRDLLRSSDSPKSAHSRSIKRQEPPKLQVRGDASTGVYVQNLSQSLVTSYPDIEIIYLLASFSTVYLMYAKFKATYDHNHDTFRLEFLILPSAALALLINHDFSPIEIMWTFSIYLEAVAILPQLFMVSKTGEAESITSHYLFALGSYRALYIINWVYRYYMEGFYDMIATLAGIVQTVLYCDFFYLYITKVLKGKKLQLPA